MKQWLKERDAKGAYSNCYLNLTEKGIHFRLPFVFGMDQNSFFFRM